MEYKFDVEDIEQISDEGLLEIWRDVRDFEGFYQVSNLGRVRSLDRLGDNGRLYKGVIKSAGDNGRGYLQVNLKVKGKQKSVYVHRLVAEAFIPNPENKPEVNHCDGDKTNCFEDNLEWTTHIENVRHAFDNGLNANAGAPQKVYVFDGDHTIVYKSLKQFGNSIGKSDTWCGKRLEKADPFSYNGLTVSRTEIDYGTRIVYNVDDVGEINDGYHSVDELYDHRATLFAAVCKAHTGKAWKSRLHHDGTMFDGGYFIVGIETPAGQFSYHYKMERWDLFDVTVREYAPEWDGHEARDVVRLLTL